MSNAKDALIGMCREEYQKRCGREPTGKDARQIEKMAAQAAQQAAARQQRRWNG